MAEVVCRGSVGCLLSFACDPWKCSRKVRAPPPAPDAAVGEEPVRACAGGSAPERESCTTGEMALAGATYGGTAGDAFAADGDAAVVAGVAAGVCALAVGGGGSSWNRTPRCGVACESGVAPVLSGAGRRPLVAADAGGTTSGVTAGLDAPICSATCCSSTSSARCAASSARSLAGRAGAGLRGVERTG